MKAKYKTVILSALLIVSSSFTVFAGEYNPRQCSCGNPEGKHEVGTGRFVGSSNTYGYSWIQMQDSYENASVYTQVTVGGNSKVATGWNYAQTEQIYYEGQRGVYESHGYF